MRWRLVSIGRFLLWCASILLPVVSAAPLWAESPEETPNHRGAEHRKAEMPAEIENILWLLPSDTAAFVVSRGDVPTPALRHANPQRPTAGPRLVNPIGYEYSTHKHEYQDLVAMCCIEPLVFAQAVFPGESRLEIISSFYGQNRTSFVAKAVRCGSVTRDSCDIVSFREPVAEKLVRILSKFPSVQRTIRGIHVTELNLNDVSNGGLAEATVPEGLDLKVPNRRWICAIGSRLYVSATRVELLSTMIDRARHRAQARALPDHLKEWQYVDFDKPAWGVRHYRADDHADSLSMLKYDNLAEGMVFYGGAQPSQFMALRYVSKSVDGEVRFRRMSATWLRPFALREIELENLPAIKSIDANCHEMRTLINQPNDQGRGQSLSRLSIDATFFTCVDAMYFPVLGFSAPR